MTGEFVSLASARGSVCPEVFAVLAGLDSDIWRLRKQGHKFYLYCGFADKCWIRVDGTPRNCGNDARRISRQIARCTAQP